MEPARHHRPGDALTLAQRIDAVALVIDFLDLLDGDIEATPEDDMDVEDWNVAMRQGGCLLGPGDLDDAEPDDEDTGAPEDEGVGPAFHTDKQVGCYEFDGI